MDKSLDIAKSTGKPDKRKKNGKSIDLKKLFDYRYNKCLTHDQIGSLMGYGASHIKKVLAQFKPIFENHDIIKTYHSNKSDILTHGELIILTEMLSKDKLVKGSINNLAFAWDKLHAARRLNDDQSTGNVGVSVEVRLSKALEKSIDNK